MAQKQLEGLDLNLLLALHWLLTERNVTAAAGKIGLSQPAASRALARLREIFDDPLLVKSGSEMAATPVAEKLQPAVALAIERCRDVLRVAETFDPSTQTGRFRIACADYVGAMVAAAWAAAVTKAAPGLDLDLVTLSLEAGRELASGKIDLVIVPDAALMNLPPSFDVEQFVRRPVKRQTYLSAVRKGHPLAKEKMTLKRFVAYDHILVTPSNARIGVVDRALAERGLERRIAYRTSSFLLSLPIVTRTDCIITAPDGLIALADKKLATFPPPIPLNDYGIHGAWHPNWTHDERHKWVRDRLFAELAD